MYFTSRFYTELYGWYLRILSDAETPGGKQEEQLMTDIERIHCGLRNAYLVTENNKSILVDTCARGDRKKLLAACKGRNVVMIFLTHGHCDHAGNAAYLARELNAPIAMSRADFPLIANNYDQTLSAHTAFGRVLLSASLRNFDTVHTEQFTPALFVNDGFRFDEYGVSARVIGLEGHTAGSLGLQVDDGCAVIVGDALVNFYYPTAAPIYSDRRKARKSVDAIARMGEEVMIYFGHGSPVKNRKKYR